MNLRLATLALCVYVFTLSEAKASAAVTSSPAAQASHSVASPSNATCPYRTINYITHGLPQQCLTSTWRSTSTALPDNATDTVLATETSADYQVTLGSGTGSNSQTTDATEYGLDTPSDIVSSSATASSPTQSTEPSSASASPIPSHEPEEPSPLEDDKFMSFEEWKKQNLQKAGQSEHIGRDKGEPHQQRKRPANIHSALDSLGDDTEIDLDFSGFIPEGPDLASVSAPTESGEPQHVQSDLETATTPSVHSRSKDAGTTSKERFNYASFDCAADILKANSEVSNAGAVLGENKDNYMLNVCSADNKFLILKLCDDISIDTIVLANFEFFSSIFRTFRVSVSDKYPVKVDKWKTIGTFEARNTRDVQAFLVENPTIWAKFLRIEFLTHYGSEYYCPVSLVRVHGTTMFEDYKREAELLLSGEDDESEIVDAESSVEETLVPEAIAAPILEERQEQSSKQIEQQVSSTMALQEQPLSTAPTESTAASPSQASIVTGKVNERTEASTSLSPKSKVLCSLVSQETCSSATAFSSGDLVDNEGHINFASNTSTTPTLQGNSSTEGFNVTLVANATNKASATAKQTTTSTDSLSSLETPGVSKLASNATATDRAKTTPSSTQTQPAAPTIQDSFFKSVQKRLQMLESNSSLSLEYIEDQSRALRDAFNKVEQRQVAKTTTFLDYLNTTVLSELRDFRQQYDQLWQSTVIELEMQRERYQQENAAINARLGILADELIFQKRMSILQMVLILICLALVLFAKGALNQYLEIPVVQRVLARSPSNKWLNLTNLDTPTQSPPATRQNSLRKRQGILKGHRRMQSEDSIEGSLSPNDIYPSPPTPTSMTYEELQSPGEAMQVEKVPPLEDPEFDPSMLERPSTSPPILPSEMPSSPEFTGLKEGETIDSRLNLGLSSPPTSPEPLEEPPLPVPRLVVEEATPERQSKHLTWRLPDS